MKRRRTEPPPPDQCESADDFIGDDPEPEDGWRAFDERGRRLPRKKSASAEAPLSTTALDGVGSVEEPARDDKGPAPTTLKRQPALHFVPTSLSCPKEDRQARWQDPIVGPGRLLGIVPDS